MANELEITLSLPLVETLLAVAIHPDKTIGELAKAAGVRNGTMGRWLSDLSDVNRSGSPGLGLVDQNKYLYDNRHTRNRLSVKGRTLVQKIAGVMDL
jgi:DNA-binding MarR family transcriptional regulator